MDVSISSSGLRTLAEDDVPTRRHFDTEGVVSQGLDDTEPGAMRREGKLQRKRDDRGEIWTGKDMCKMG